MLILSVVLDGVARDSEFGDTIWRDVVGRT